MLDSLFTDVLLCHDDELEGRRIAFILYLVPPWLSTDGGSLDLFGTNGKNFSLMTDLVVGIYKVAIINLHHNNNKQIMSM